MVFSIGKTVGKPNEPTAHDAVFRQVFCASAHSALRCVFSMRDIVAACQQNTLRL